MELRCGSNNNLVEDKKGKIEKGFLEPIIEQNKGEWGCGKKKPIYFGHSAVSHQYIDFYLFRN
jgi:hypothetical protein